VRIRELERQEIRDLWSIDRAELVDKVYYHEDGELVLKPEHHDTQGWPPGEPERYGPILIDCFDRGGTFYGAFDGETLIGATVLESRFIGRERDQLQLKFLHVGRRHRRTGLGRTLFEKAVARARELGARRLYISSTPSENTVRFYLRRGCRVTDAVDAALFELEPEDIHLKFDIPACVGRGSG
jgi:predicted N-acetyltransferase YhbS